MEEGEGRGGREGEGRGGREGRRRGGLPLSRSEKFLVEALNQKPIKKLKLFKIISCRPITYC